MSEYISTSEAATVIGCNGRRVRQLCQAGRVAARRIGRDWVVERASAERYRDSARKPGRRPAGASRGASEPGTTAETP